MYFKGYLEIYKKKVGKNNIYKNERKQDIANAICTCIKMKEKCDKIICWCKESVGDKLRGNLLLL